MKANLYEWDGKQVSGPKLAAEHGIKWPKLYQRLQRGWSLADALNYRAQPARYGSAESRAEYHRKRAEWHLAEARRIEQVPRSREVLPIEAYADDPTARSSSS